MIKKGRYQPELFLNIGGRRENLLPLSFKNNSCKSVQVKYGKMGTDVSFFNLPDYYIQK